MLLFLCALLLIPQSTTQQELDPCTLAPETGLCLAVIPRYYYNATSNRCEIFSYGGCGGNENNFKSLYHCNSKCVQLPTECSLDKDTGSPDCSENLQRYFFNNELKKCKKMFYSGCGGNENRFNTKKECKRRCTIETENCGLTTVAGTCDSNFTRYAFNLETATCDEFIYGGCEGNRNNFDTKGKCERKCIALNQPTRKRRSVGATVNETDCKLPFETGVCRAYMPSYYFNYETGICEVFVYGGCDGNNNRFSSVEECERNCGQYRSPIFNATRDCQLPPIQGPCEAAITRYFYNKTSGRCQHFVYGGCLGNNNRFETIDECNMNCGNVFDANTVCKLEPEAGICLNFVRKYYYDATSRSCKQFDYSGCLGNDNKFNSEVECLERCSGVTRH